VSISGLRVAPLPTLPSLSPLSVALKKRERESERDREGER
jgi:hypothetical protein